MATFGLNSGNIDQQEFAGAISAARVQNTAGDGILTKLEILIAASLGSNVRLGVYADNNGQIGQLILDAGEIQGVNGWASISDLALPVVANAYYWLANVQDGEMYIRMQTTIDPDPETVWGYQAYRALPTMISEQGNSFGKYVKRAEVTSDTGAPMAMFTANPVTGPAPLQVTLTDQSLGNITSWAWDFGDGTGLQQQHAVNTYATPGTYIVSLTVSGPNGPDSSATEVIVVTDPVSNSTQVGQMELKVTIENIGVISNFSGDLNGNNEAQVEYRKFGDSTWKKGVAAEPQVCPVCNSILVFPIDADTWMCTTCNATWPTRTMVPDRRLTILDDNGINPNPYVNQQRAVLFWLTPNTEYEVRVTYTDPDGVSGENPMVRTIRTRNDNPPSNGRVLYVSTGGLDTNDGSLGSPWRTIQHAADQVIAGDRVKLLPGTYSGNITLNSKYGLVNNYITFESYDPLNRAVISGGDNNFWMGQCRYIRLSKLELTSHVGSHVDLKGCE